MIVKKRQFFKDMIGGERIKKYLKKIFQLISKS